MQDRRRVEPKLEVLSEPAAARLLARASELDAALARRCDADRPPHRGSGSRDLVGSVRCGAGRDAGGRARAGTRRDAAAAPAILLRCLSGGQAAALVRPLLQLSANRIVISPHAPEVLTVRGTPAQITQVRRVLDESAGAGASCHSARSR